MDNTEVLLSIKDFEQRYKLTRSNIYNRINGLKEKGYQLEPMKQGARSIFTAEQGAIMDRLHSHLLAGNDIGSFPDAEGRVQMSQPIERLVEHPVGRIAAQQDSLERAPAALGVAALVDAIAGKLAEVIPTPQPDPLAELRLIQEACEQGWLLSSSQLAPLLGVKPPSGVSFQRYGFTFTRTGRNGAESAWKISKS